MNMNISNGKEYNLSILVPLALQQMVLWKGYTKILGKHYQLLKLNKKKDYDIRIALINAENAQNNVIHTVTKYKPIEIFNISNETQYEFIKDNIKNSQININKNVEKLQVNTYVINSNIYIKKRNKLKVKYNTIGVRNIPGIITGNNGNTT